MSQCLTFQLSVRLTCLLDTHLAGEPPRVLTKLDCVSYSEATSLSDDECPSTVSAEDLSPLVAEVPDWTVCQNNKDEKNATSNHEIMQSLSSLSVAASAA